MASKAHGTGNTEKTVEQTLQHDFIIGALTLAGFPVLCDHDSMSIKELIGWLDADVSSAHSAAQHDRNMRLSALMYRSDSREGFGHRVRWELSTPISVGA